MKPLMLDSVAKSPRDRFLACYFVECLRTPFASDYLIGHLLFVYEVSSELARPRTFPQHTLPLLPLLRSRPGGVHKASVVRSPGSDKKLSGGEGGIRTHGTVSRSQHFQCCQFNHSCTSPDANLRFQIPDLQISFANQSAI